MHSCENETEWLAPGYRCGCGFTYPGDLIGEEYDRQHEAFQIAKVEGRE